MNDYLNYNRYESNQTEDYEEKNYNYHKFEHSKFLVAAIVIIVFLVVFFVMNKSSLKNDYQAYEQELVTKAKEYVLENSIIGNKEMYLNANTLEVNLPSNCSIKSGVIFKEDNYQAYLSCSEYETIFNEKNDQISLIGNEVEFVSLGSKYYDRGYVSDSEVRKTGYVGEEEGVYNLYYIAGSNVINRKVIITANPLLLQKFPYITLNGSSVEIVKIGSEYEEKGAIATDLKDGIITNNIVKYGNVDVNKVGVYEVYYSITNNEGYTSVERKRVEVKDNPPALTVVHELSPTEKTGGEVEILVNVIGDNYYYTVLPDGVDNNTDNVLSYVVNENGTYRFEIHDMEDNIINYDVSVTNINVEKPSGTCKVLVYADKTNISVSAKSSNGILGYNYYINNAGTGYRVNNSYTTSIINPSSVYVDVLDKIGNSGRVNCTFEDKRTYNDPNGITRTLNGNALKVPIAEALAKKGWTISDLNACIYNKVKAAGPGTRYGVMASAVGLIECTKNMTGYVIPYDHTGGKVEDNYCSFNSDICGKLGVNSRWGRPGGSQNTNYGLNCANFVHWSFCNGGMDMCSKGAAGAGTQASKKYYPEANIVTIYKGTVKHVLGENLTNRYSALEIAKMLKPGDVLHMIIPDNSKSEHVTVVIGKDNTGVYIAENGSKMRKINYSTIVNSERKYRLLLLDNYYANINNRNNLYR